MDKTFPSIEEALKDIPDGASIAVSGFFTAGTPVPLIKGLAQQGAKDLTIICLTMGPGNEVMNELVVNKQIKKAISDYPFYRSVSQGANSPFEAAVRAEEIDVEIYPLGTFVEKLRAGGAGIAGFYVRTGAGTVFERGKEKREFNGQDYILELALQPDYSFIYAHKADRMGNIVFRKTAMNLNPEIAQSAKITIAAVENIVETGELKPEEIDLPGIYVHRVVKVDRPHYFPSM